MAFTFFEDCNKYSKTMADQIIAFLVDNPETLNWRGKRRPDLTRQEGQAEIRAKMAGAFTKFLWPTEPATVPDAALLNILRDFYQIDDVKRAIQEHRQAMVAENFVGYMLEMYILSEAFESGWCLCPNAIITSVDFIKKNDDDSWLALQVKSRDNSENSSSRRVRDGTEIRHWFRSFSRKKATNWENFPDKNLSAKLNEENFLKFIGEYRQNFPKTT